MDSWTDKPQFTKSEFGENAMSEVESLPAALAPDAHTSLSSAKMMLSRAVEAMLNSSKYDHAKDVIDILARVDRILLDKNLAPKAMSDSRFTPEEVEMIVQGRKIDAIKKVRERTGYGLKEAKDLVESYRG